MTPRHKTSNLGPRVEQGLSGFLGYSTLSELIYQFFYNKKSRNPDSFSDIDISDCGILCPVCGQDFLQEWDFNGEERFYRCSECNFVVGF